MREGDVGGLSVLDRRGPVPSRRELSDAAWTGALRVLRVVALCAGWALVLGAVALWIALALHDAPA
jgi:hypothetical protein